MEDLCLVCCEQFNNSTRKEIKCNNCDYSACKTCIRTFLTSQSKDPHCLNCKVGITRENLVLNLNRSFVDKEYRNNREKVLTEIEMSKMPDTMVYAEQVKAAKKLEETNISLNNEIKEYVEKIRKIKRSIFRNTIRIQHPERYTSSTLDDRKQFIMACPDPDCRGFLSSAYKCGLCNMFTCPDCLMIIGENKNEEHKCCQDNVKSAELIKKETKPCPSCGDRIFKIEGCDQMFCTSIRKDGGGICQTAFSWRTGKIETGTIHNPHYYALLKKNNNLVRNPGDIVCGGVPDIRHIGSLITILMSRGNLQVPYSLTNNNQDRLIHHTNIQTLADIYSIHQLVAEINQYELPQLRREVTALNDNRGIRIKYLLKEITKEEMGKLVNKNDIIRQKKIELLNVMEIISTSGIEFLNDLLNSYSIDINDFAAPYGPILLIGNERDREKDIHSILNFHFRQIGQRVFFETEARRGAASTFDLVSLFGFYIKSLNYDTYNKHVINIKKQTNDKLVNFKKIIEYCNNELKKISVSYNCRVIQIKYYDNISTIQNDFYNTIRYCWSRKSCKYAMKDIK